MKSSVYVRGYPVMIIPSLIIARSTPRDSYRYKPGNSSFIHASLGKPSVTKVFITWHEAVEFDLIATESDELSE